MKKGSEFMQCHYECIYLNDVRDELDEQKYGAIISKLPESSSTAPTTT